MSNSVYPVLPGIAFGTVRSPTWSTKIQTAVSGKELRAAFWSTPIWKYTLVYEFLRTASAFQELQTLFGFYNQRQGQFDSFLFSAPDDNSVTAEPFGTGTGSQTVFQLKRSFGGFSESVVNVNVFATLFVNGVAKTYGTDYTVDNTTGLVTFVSAPAAAAALTWTGTV
jgi:uncharacterized protein (TIGR02217 family)